MTGISFDQFKFSDDGGISLRFKTANESNEIWFKLPNKTRPHNDLIACALAANFNAPRSEWTIDLPITDSCKAALSKATNSSWSAPVLNSPPPAKGTNTILNFSGGFDSLAAYALMPEAKLVSVDFGGQFTRERDFFKNFPTQVVQTNAREFSTAWTFMAVGAILMREELSGSTIAFGTIFEASPWNFLKTDRAHSTNGIFKAAGLEVINPILGLSEFGSTMLAYKAFPEDISESLNSLADPGTEKFERKLLMLRAVANHLSTDIPGVDFSDSRGAPSPMKFGRSFAGDFLMAGMVKFLGKAAVSNWMEVPKQMESFVQDMKLDFYWRENPGLALQGTDEQRAVLNAQKTRLGIRPYMYDDWMELKRVESLMRLNHVFPSHQVLW